MNNVVQ